MMNATDLALAIAEILRRHASTDELRVIGEEIGVLQTNMQLGVLVRRLSESCRGIQSQRVPRQRAFDHDAAVERVKAGETLRSIAQDYGVSYQAISQAVERRGASSRDQRKQANKNRKITAMKIFRDTAGNLKETSRITGYSVETLRRLSYIFDIRLPIKYIRVKDVLDELQPIIYQIENGRSIRSLCNGDHALEGRVRTAMKMLGITNSLSKKKRRSDFGKTKDCDS